MPRMVRHLILVAAVCVVMAAVLAEPPLPQPLAYHNMADERSWLGIPNALNVLSNLPFAAIGVLGLIEVFRAGSGRRSPFQHLWERWPYAALFAGVALTSVGSSYYHLAPDNARLVWDRLPMTLGFMGLLAAVLAERVSLPVARWLFVPLLVVGGGSVGYWYWTEVQGAGDLRPYLLVQFGSLVIVFLLLALYPARYVGGRYLIAGLTAYAAAKGFELADGAIFSLGGIVSGHTLKHLVAAGGVGCLIVMLRVRGDAAANPRRRDVLAALAAAGAAAFLRTPMSAQQNVPAVAAVDHLLLGTNDLDRGIAWFEQRSGVKAAIGGSHPGRGTRNALASLGGRHYLEIIAPDPEQPSGNLTMNLRALAEPRLIAWAAATTDIGGIARRIRDRGNIAAPRDGSRARPDGRMLRWRTLTVQTDLAREEVNPIPFFIEWASDSVHPSEDSPKGCDLAAFEFEHPDPKALGSALATLGIDAPVRQAAEVRLVARLKTPKGLVVLI
jgi:glyoxalase-like protein